MRQKTLLCVTVLAVCCGGTAAAAQNSGRSVSGRLLNYGPRGMTIIVEGRTLRIPVHRSTTVRVEAQDAGSAASLRVGACVTVSGRVVGGSVLERARIQVHANPAASFQPQTHTSESSFTSVSGCNARVVSLNPLTVTSIDTFELTRPLHHRNYGAGAQLATKVRNKSFIVDLHDQSRIEVLAAGGMQFASQGDRVDVYWSSANSLFPSSINVSRPKLPDDTKPMKSSSQDDE